MKATHLITFSGKVRNAVLSLLLNSQNILVSIFHQSMVSRFVKIKNDLWKISRFQIFLTERPFLHSELRN